MACDLRQTRETQGFGRSTCQSDRGTEWGDCQNRDLQVEFNRRLKLKFLGSKVTTDAGLLAYRELDEVLGLSEISEEVLTDSRLGSNKQHQLVPPLRQSIDSQLAGYEDVNDAERLAIDSAMCHVVDSDRDFSLLAMEHMPTTVGEP